MRTAAIMRRTMPYYSFYPQTPRSVANCRDYRPSVSEAVGRDYGAPMYSRLICSHGQKCTCDFHEPPFASK